GLGRRRGTVALASRGGNAQWHGHLCRGRDRVTPQLHRRAAEATLALAMLTRLPVPQLRDCPPVGASAWAWPLAGATVGGLQAIVLLAAAALLPPAMAAGLALAAGLLLTGALHEDGLADLADGLSGGRSPVE